MSLRDDDAAEIDFGYKPVAPFPREKFLQFISKLKVQSKDYGLVPFKLLGSQMYILDEICEALSRGVTTVVILKARQLGSSTFFLALDMFWAFMHKGLVGVFMTHEEASRDDFRAAIEVFFAETPRTHLVKYVRHNRNLLILKNGSRFRYLIAGTSELRRAGVGRSGAANYLHATEYAFYGNGDQLAEFRSQMSSLYPHRLQIYESTANGFNHAWDFWEEAKSDPTKKAVFVGWYRDERNAFATDDPRFAAYMPDGAKSALSPLERRRVRLVRELYDIDISVQQIAWYRYQLQSEKGGDQGVMDQEVPWTDEDAFVATGSKFFTTEAVTVGLREAKRRPFQTYRYKLTHKFEETRVVQVRDVRAELRIWEDASKFGYYVAGCDPAYGSSDQADRTCISIWRCYADCMTQVAEYTTPSISTYQCAWVLAHLCGYYGTTWLMPVLEISGPGQAVFDELLKVQKLVTEIRPIDDTYNIRNVLSSMRHFYYKRLDHPGGGDLVYHWKTTEELKRRMMNQYKNGVELGRAMVRSVPLLEEMRRIVNDEGHIGAEGHAKDDRVMAAALAYQGWNTWAQPRCKTAGMTKAHADEVDARGGIEPVDRLITRFMKRMNIEVGR